MASLVAVLFFVLVSRSAASGCRHWRLDLDAVGNTLFLAGDRRFVVPSTVAQVETEYCKKNLKSIDELRNISRSCFTPFVKQVAGLMTYGFRKSVRRICTDSRSKEQVLQKFKCLRNETNKQILDSTMFSFVLQLEHVRDNVANSSHMMLEACCAYEAHVKVSNYMLFISCIPTNLHYRLPIS